MSARVEARFAALAAEGRKGLIPFITAGDPHPDWTVDVMHALVAGGASLIELGVPFSDPMADGPVIQVASERAIERGVSLAGVLDMVRRFRADDAETPVILMGYMNPVEKFGAGRLAEAAAEAGVDGFLLVDCPPEESPELQQALAEHDIDCIRLVAPTTTEERLAHICAAARGFVYYVSFKGITGASRLDTSALAEPVARIREHTDLPVAAGFGITGPETAVATASVTDAVVIGSALVKRLSDAPDAATAAERGQSFVASVREALDNSQP